MFLTGTAAELVPVREIDDHSVGEPGAPGESPRAIQQRVRRRAARRAPRYREWLDVVEVPLPARRRRHGLTIGPRIELYDTTLRDGMQGEGMSLSAAEKLRVAHRLDELGIELIEAGFPSSNPKELELFELLARERFEHAADRRVRDDPPPRRERPEDPALQAWPTASRRSARSSARPGACTSRRSSRSTGRRTWR